MDPIGWTDKLRAQGAATVISLILAGVALAVFGVPSLLCTGSCSGSEGVMDEQCVAEGKPPGCWRLRP